MKFYLMEHTNKKAFTLIELLVVIAIIALLLSIIMPALGKAKKYAEEILCKSNLHQYSLATEMYANENNDHMPDPRASLYSKMKFLDESKRYCRWHNPNYNLDAYADKLDSTGPGGKPYAGPYWPYLAATKANICPTFSKLAPKYGMEHMEGNGNLSASDCIGGPFKPQFSYSMNRIFLKTIKNNGNKTIVPVRKSAIRSPSQTFLWAEENMWTLTGLSDFVLNDNSLYVKEDTIIDCFGSFHKISGGRLSIQQNTRQYENGSGVSNVLLVDGSARQLSPIDSITYKGKAQ